MCESIKNRMKLLLFSFLWDLKLPPKRNLVFVNWVLLSWSFCASSSKTIEQAGFVQFNMGVLKFWSYIYQEFDIKDEGKNFFFPQMWVLANGSLGKLDSFNGYSLVILTPTSYTFNNNKENYSRKWSFKSLFPFPFPFLPLPSPSLHHKPSQKKFANGDGIV